MKKTKLERASLCVECGPNVRVDEDGCCAACGASATGPWADKAVAALKAQALGAVQRAERAVVRAAMAYAAPGIGISGQHQYDRLVDRCNGLQNTKAKAKKARRP